MKRWKCMCLQLYFFIINAQLGFDDAECTVWWKKILWMGVCAWHSLSFSFRACRLEACSNSVGSVCPTEGIYMRLQGSWWPIWRKLFLEELSRALSGPRQQRTQQWNQPIIALPEDLACLSPPPACKHWQHTAWGKARRSCLEGKKMADKSSARAPAALSTCQGREPRRRFVFQEYAWVYCAKCAVTEDVWADLESECGFHEV